MYISKLKISNYKSFSDSEWMNFQPGINLICGQNNSGKTALLEALSLEFDDFPHRSLKTLPNYGSQTNNLSEVNISLILEIGEIKKLIIDEKSQLNLPRGKNPKISMEDAAAKLTEILNSSRPIEINISYLSRQQDIQSHVFNNENSFKELTFNIYEPEYPLNFLDARRVMLWAFELTSENLIKPVSLTNGDLNAIFSFKPFQIIKERNYRFHAERMNLGTCEFGDRQILEPNASNLAEVINNLQSNPEKFNRFNKLVSIVLPQIQRVTVQPKPSNKLEIIIWTVDPKSERQDLAFPLSTCGTGVSQVLAILYVVLVSQEARVIIIDEPQSFLHPGAARKLIEILRDFPQHQYFIATHSPMVISAANPSTIILLKHEDSETKSYEMSSNDAEELHSLLDEVGVRLSDVFGADNILWVEGETEEKCFPLILECLAQLHLRGTQILAIKPPGNLEGKRSHIIFDIYDRLSGGKLLFPPAIAFVLDRENKTEKHIEDFKRRNNAKVHFINRRMYENYLLHPDAIVAVANQQSNFRDPPLSNQEVKEWLEDKKQKWLEDKKQNGSYLSKDGSSQDLTDKIWLQKVDGAKLLEDIFAQYSENRVVFRKTKHSFELTKWLVEHQPESLTEIEQLLREIFSNNS